MLSKIWERYIFFQALKFLFFFLFCIYAIYVLIDFSTHSARLFTYSAFAYLDLFLYYLHHFVMRLYLFFPLALLFSILKVFGSMNLHNELVSLRMSGLSMPMLARPFFLLSLMITLLTYVNFEFFAPKSYQFTTYFKESHLRKPKENNRKSLHILPASNHSKIIYQKKLPEENILFDVFWIISKKEIWHIKKLSLEQPFPIGFYVDKLLYDSNGRFIKEASYNQWTFSGMNIFSEKAQNTIPYEHYSISSLTRTLYKKESSSKIEKAHLLTQLHYKLSMPLFSFLISLGLIPYILIFSRNFRFLILTLCALFGYVVFFTMMDATVILGENNVFSPVYCLWSPILLSLLFALRNFHKKSHIQ